MLRKLSFLLFFTFALPSHVHAHENHNDDKNNYFFSSLEKSRVSITKDTQYRYIRSNGIPNHQTGQFPNRGNPNSISAQNHQYRVPLVPQKTSTANAKRGVVGVALNGIPFEPSTAEFWNNDRSSGLNYEALSGKINLGLDQHNAHVQPTGTYHYHGIPSALVTKPLSLVGYAADGFPMYVSQSGQYKSSYRLKSGQRSNGPGGKYNGTFTSDYEYLVGQGDLDQCNGMTLNGQYVYFITEEFPQIPRCLFGKADNSFERQPQSRGSNSQRGGQRRPPPGHRPPPRY